ncbi:MAG: M42 family metallopeptidase [Longimicrobiales bacterium]
MASPSEQFFQDLLNTPGVSGYEQTVQQVVRDYITPFADEVVTDLHGNVIATKNEGAELRLMFAGHCDQLGLVVSHIDEKGFIYVQTVGGWDPQQLVGQCVTIWAKEGPVIGVIARKAIHLLEDSERKQVVEIKNLWIDIGASDQEDAESLVRIGDSATVRLGIQQLRNGIMSGPAMDNRTGVWIVMEAFRRAVEKGVECSLHTVSTVQEEIGLRGARTAAYGIDPQVGIAVDVTHATDCPGIDKRQRGDVSLGGGPVIARGPNVNPVVCERLLACAADGEIPHQIASHGRAAPNDANPLQVTRGGVATGLVQIPNRYMHSAVETISWSDLDHTADLLAEFACRASDVSDFIPS